MILHHPLEQNTLMCQKLDRQRLTKPNLNLIVRSYNFGTGEGFLKDGDEASNAFSEISNESSKDGKWMDYDRLTVKGVDVVPSFSIQLVVDSNSTIVSRDERRIRCFI